MVTPINDLDTYNEGMRRGMNDKLWFINRLEGIDYLTDFGCADGTLLEEVHKLRPALHLSGMDMDKNMIALAEARVPDAAFSVSTAPHSLRPNEALVLSSVIHEIYSYADADKFWADINNSGYDTIFIRDMIRPAAAALDFTSEDYRNVVRRQSEDQIKSFEDIWGPITYPSHLYHFLLKYRFVKNWDREVKEDYLPMGLEDWYKVMDSKLKNYYIDELRVYTLPYLAEKWKRDFGIHLHAPTHVQIVLKTRDTGIYPIEA